MNTRAKGRKRELACKKSLEMLGYSVQLAPLPSKWSLQNDLFGLWDVMAVNSTQCRFIQVKPWHIPSKAWRDAAAAWQCPPNCTKEVWMYKDRVKDPKIIIL